MRTRPASATRAGSAGTRPHRRSAAETPGCCAGSRGGARREATNRPGRSQPDMQDVVYLPAGKLGGGWDRTGVFGLVGVAGGLPGGGVVVARRRRPQVLVGSAPVGRARLWVLPAGFQRFLSLSWSRYPFEEAM